MCAMKIWEFKNTPAWFEELARFGGNAAAAGDISKTVAEVLTAVRNDGDAAVLAYTEKFDQAKLSAKDLRVSDTQLASAAQVLKPAERKAIREAMRCVREYHKHTLPKDWEAKNPQGARVGERFYPIQRVGLYIPGGGVPLVSTVIMTAVLAKLVKVPEIVVCTPPQADGEVSPGMLAALAMVGIKEVYKVGGVQAIGALAYGTKTIPAVDKIFGPGNAFVMEAKRQVFGTVGVDLLPGPSEVMVLADSGANPRHVAADLLAQAEHGSGKELVFLVSTSGALIKKVVKALDAQVGACAHAEKIRYVLENRTLAVRVRSLEQATAVANFLAPEHLELQVKAASIAPLSKAITTAGALLQGYATPTVLGDFTAGPSHTLPTGRAGRFFSGLQATDFLRRSSTVRYDRKSMEAARPVVETFAKLERLDAHGNSLFIRLEDKA